MVHKPLGLLAELTHRCPLGCPYCSNPLAFDAREDELDTATWARVFREAAGLGVLQVHLSGGEPGARRDLVDITAGAHAAGLYTNLITSAIGITDKTLGALSEAGHGADFLRAEAARSRHNRSSVADETSTKGSSQGARSSVPEYFADLPPLK